MKKGFTLLEVVIAITILCLVALIVGSSVRLGLKAWDKGEASADVSMRIRALSERVTQQLKSVYPYKIFIDGKFVYAFEGKPDGLWFAASTPNYLYGGFKWVSFFMKEGSLMLGEGLIPDKQLLSRVTEGGEVFDPDVKNVRFSYLSATEGDWKDEWPLGDTFPTAVKVVLDGLTFVVNIPSVIVEK